MLVDCLTVPHSPEAWERFAFANNDAVNQINQAITAQTGVQLATYQLYPINFDDPSFFLENNQQAHIQFTQATGGQSADLQDVDLKDPKQLESWINLNWLELNSACVTLKIGP